MQELLACAQIQVNCVDSEGRTPLHLAAATSNEKAITMLLDYGADVVIEDKYGQTSVQVAQATVQRLRRVQEAGAVNGGVPVAVPPRAHTRAASARHQVLRILPP